MTVYDVLVVGLGAMGSACAYQLAARGCRVVGVDAFDPPHTNGSTHGRSRIIREAYYEHPGYVPLVRRAYENWATLERDAGLTLFQRTGGLMIGLEDSGLVRGTLASAQAHGIAVEVLSATEIRSRFPSFAPRREMIGVLELRAGVLFPEACVRALLTGARALGAHIRLNERVSSLRTDSDATVTAVVPGGVITARRVIIASGPWAAPLLASLGITLPLVVERQTMHWLDSRGDSANLAPDRMPVMMIEHESDRFFYGIPDFGDGVKAAIHHEGVLVSPDGVDRAVSEADTQPVLSLVDQYLPAASGRIRESAVCLYTDTPDFDFIIGPLAGMPNVVLVSACSGHGFKFASAIGEVAARMALEETVPLDLSQFGAGRFALHDRRP